MLATSVIVNDHNNPNFNKVTTNLKKELNITDENAASLASEVFKQQETLSEGCTVLFKQSETLPFALSISQDYIGWQQKKVGSGGEFAVYQTMVFPTKRFLLLGENASPSKPFCAATKIAHRPETSLTPKRKMLDQIFKNDDETYRATVDRFLKNYRDENGKACSLHHYHPTDLHSYSFKKGDTITISDLIKVFISVSSVYAFINENHFIHRDIKPKNILIGEPCRGIVSDFGHLLKVPTKMHKTAGTPRYMDTYMFGGVNDNLVNQNQRQGLQTIEGEVFALGRTLSETLIKLLKELSKELERSEGSQLGDLVEKINFKRSNLDISNMTFPMINSELKEKSLKHPFLANCHTITDSRTKKIFLDLYLFPPLSDRKTNYSKACSMLHDLLEQNEIDALICLAILSCNMQEELKKRPTMEQVHLEFETILTTFEEKGDFQALKDSLTQNPKGIQKRAKVDLSEAFKSSVQETN